MSDIMTAPPLAGPGRLATTSKVLVILGILAALLVPQMLIDSMIAEREGRRDAVQAEIARGWAGPQTILGPVLVVPWRAPIQRDATGAMAVQRGSVAVLPASLRARADLVPETRRRGLFEATVYLARLNLSGSFALPEVTVPGVPEAELAWDEAYLMVGSRQLRPAGMAPGLTFDGSSLQPGEIEPDAGLCGPAEALRWPLGLAAAPEPGRPLGFETSMELRGTSGFRIVPLARRSTVAIGGTWPTPSFTGAELPARSNVEEGGFEAEWNTGLGAPVVRRSLGACGHETGLMAKAVGVELLEAVPTYRMVDRASKYTLFFLALTFVTYAIFELTANVRLHAVQYGLLGASVVLFPLLLLAIGEPLGFSAAYAIATAMVVAQATIYTAVVTRLSLGLVLAGVLAALFGFLHVVLSLEAYALLVGTLALFTALSIVMAVTRKVRWHAG